MKRSFAFLATEMERLRLSDYVGDSYSYDPTANYPFYLPLLHGSDITSKKKSRTNQQRMSQQQQLEPAVNMVEITGHFIALRGAKETLIAMEKGLCCVTVLPCVLAFQRILAVHCRLRSRHLSRLLRRLISQYVYCRQLGDRSCRQLGDRSLPLSSSSV